MLQITDTLSISLDEIEISAITPATLTDTPSIESPVRILRWRRFLKT